MRGETLHDEEVKAVRSFAALTRTRSVDSNETADNLPGPGRNVGLLLDWAGKKLERLLGSYMARRGHGPDAVADAIAGLRRYNERRIVDFYVDEARKSEPQLSDLEQRKLRKECRRLVRYTRSKAESTAIAACDRITDLACQDPYVRRLLFDSLPSFDPIIFSELSLSHYESRSMLGRSSRDWDPLLASSRKALISVSEVEVHKLWSSLYITLSLRLDPHGYKRTTLPWIIQEFLPKLRVSLNDATLSFLSMRHMLQALSLIPFDRKSRRDRFGRLHLAQVLLYGMDDWMVQNMLASIPSLAIEWDILEAIFSFGTETVHKGSWLQSHSMMLMRLGLTKASQRKLMETFSEFCHFHGRNWDYDDKRRLLAT